MNSVRMTTSPQQVPERPDGAAVAQRNEPRRVGGVEGVEADRRRSLREELKASEERFPDAMSASPVPDEWPEAPADPLADAHAVAEAISRLGSEATKVLHPLDEREIRRILPGHVDEQA